MLANFLIGLREGLEAALIVGILVAYLVKIDQRQHISKIALGTSVAVLISIGLGLGISTLSEETSEVTAEAIAGVTSLIAVGFVSWMIFWMARTSRTLGTSLRSKIDSAVGQSGWSLAVVAFLAVIREGVETAIFIWTASQSAGGGANPVVGAFAGLVVASALGYLIYRGALKLNLSNFFKYTGAFLIVLAAGILSYGLGELQEINWLPILTATAYDLTPMIPEGGWAETILKGALLYNGDPNFLQVIAWVAYTGTVGSLFAREYQKKLQTA